MVCFARQAPAVPGENWGYIPQTQARVRALFKGSRMYGFAPANPIISGKKKSGVLIEEVPFLRRAVQQGD